MSRPGVSLKRSIATLLFPYSALLDRTNWTAKWKRTVTLFEGMVSENREQMYRDIHRLILGNIPIDYVEFGVADGSSLRSWCAVAQHPDSRFFGFDCFTGLPEDWNSDRPKGTFNRDGIPPQVADGRVRFQVGQFQDSLPGFLDSYEPRNRLVIHNDSDLYSSTLYMLTMMDGVMRPGTIVIFDEFWDALHEYRALIDYANSYRRSFEIITATRHFSQVGILVH